MAVLPVDDLQMGTITEQTEPSLTWKISGNRITGEVDGWDAVRQAVEIILNTERFKWQIYAPSSGVEYVTLIGQNPGFVAIELQRRLRSALLMDSRITGISEYKYTINGDSLQVDFTVNTIFGDIRGVRTEVAL